MNLKKTKLNLLVLILTFLMITISGCTEQPDNNKEDNKDEGDDFTFTTLEGVEKNLSDYRGKVVVLDMWATWCSPCQYQMLELKKLYDYYSEYDLEILSIDIDTSETVSQIQEFISQFAYYGYNLEWTFGMEKDSLDIYMEEGGIPTLCIFDKQGHLYFRHVGLSYFDEIPSNWPSDQPDPMLLKEKIDVLI